MSMPPQIDAIEHQRPESQSDQQIRLWPQLPTAEQQQLARYWAQLIQRIRRAVNEKQVETSSHGT